MVTGRQTTGRWALAGEGGSETTRVALALAFALAVGVADVALGESVSLISVLVGAPIIAATAATPRSTGVVGILAVLLALALGFPNDFFGEVDHLTRVAGVLIGSALAVWVAGLRREREEDSERLAVQYDVAQTLSEARTIEEASQPLLRAVGGRLGWHFGALWVARGDEDLECVDTWAVDPRHAAGFAEATRALSPLRGEGLPWQVVEARRPVWFADLQEEQGFRRSEPARRAGLRSAAAFPVAVASEVVGVVELYSREMRQSDPQLLELMAALTAQTGEYVERLRAGHALHASEARKGAVLSSALDCVITMDHLGRVLEFNPAAERVFGYTEAEAVGREMAALIVPPSLREGHRNGLARYVRTGNSQLLGHRVELTGMRSDGSEFPVELAINRIGDDEPPTFTGTVRDISARRAADAERERLLELEREARLDATRARDQLRAILGGVADAVTVQAAEGGIVFANDAAARTLGFDSVDALIAAPVTEVMGKFDMLTESGDPFPLDQLPGRRALLGQQAEAVVRFVVRATGEERWSVVKATPLKDETGTVSMSINVIEDITDHKRSEREQQFLAESSRLLASSLDPDATLRQVAQLAVPDVADWCAVDLTTGQGQLERVALAHVDPAQVELGKELAERYPTNLDSPQGLPQVLRTGRSELYSDISDDLLQQSARDPEHLEILREVGMRSVMLVPMVIGDRTIGAMTFVSGQSGRRFDDSDVRLAEELGRRCATAIDNARLYAERAYIAKTLQESLLPAELPSIPGLEAAARFRASGDGNEVGGDFYDLFESGPTGWAVVVGDVCGKGPDAAAITALARYTLRAAAMREGHPSQSLRVLNEALLRQRTDRRFCTVAYAHFEPNGGRRVKVGFSSGGHPLPIVLRADGSVEFLGEHGTLLGVVSDPELEDRATELAPGDALVFYTDGVTEAKGPGGMLGEEQLARIVAGAVGGDADAIAARVEEVALSRQDGAPRDDIAVVVLRVPERPAAVEV